MKSRGRLAFTLVELLTVVVIVAILVALAFPVTTRMTQAGRATACFSNLRNLGAALNLYLADHNEIMPTLEAGRKSISDNVPVIDNTLNSYVRDPRVFACPGDTKGISTATGTSYYWNSAVNGQSLANLHFYFSNGENSEIPILSDKEGFHPYAANKVNILYADGHASQELKFMTQ